MGIIEKGAISPPKKEAWGKTMETLIMTSSLQNHKEINFCGLNHSVRGVGYGNPRKPISLLSLGDVLSSVSLTGGCISLLAETVSFLIPQVPGNTPYFLRDNSNMTPY